jgi:uncharacterized protein RhaS with RHS repeats
LQYSRARFYDAKLGRFISEDPIGFVGGDVNTFNYVGGNPQNFTDSLGLQGGPVNYLRDPVAHDSAYNLGGITNGLSNTMSDLLGLDEIAELSWTVGNHCLSNEERAWAGAKFGIAVVLNVGGEAVAARYLSKGVKWIRNGEEGLLPFISNRKFRVAPF